MTTIFHLSFKLSSLSSRSRVPIVPTSSSLSSISPCRRKTQDSEAAYTTGIMEVVVSTMGPRRRWLVRFTRFLCACRAYTLARQCGQPWVALVGNNYTWRRDARGCRSRCASSRCGRDCSGRRHCRSSDDGRSCEFTTCGLQAAILPSEMVSDHLGVHGRPGACFALHHSISRRQSHRTARRRSLGAQYRCSLHHESAERHVSRYGCE